MSRRTSSPPGPCERSTIDALVDSLIDAGELQGISTYETSVLQRYRGRARAFLESFAWCSDVIAERFAAGAAGIGALFAFEVLVKGTHREWLWGVAGELPSAYLPLATAPSLRGAMLLYCALLEQWIASMPARDLAPTRAGYLEPTAASAPHLERQLAVLHGYVVPALCSPEASPGTRASPAGLVITLEPP